MNYQDHVKEMMNRYQSPFFFYDLDGFEEHIKEVKRITHPDIKIWYATKANPLSEILRILKKNGFGADVASLGELKQARKAGMESHDLIATGPAKSKNYLASLMQAEVKAIIIESFNQLKNLNEIAQKLGRKQDVLLRLQLEWPGDKSLIGGSGITPFGLAPDDWRKIDFTQFANINIVGAHCFQWGNILSLSKLQEIWSKTIEEAQKLFLDLGMNLRVLDLGGGIGIPYKKNEAELHYKDIHELLMGLKRSYELKEIWLELGRFSIGKFGSYFTRVLDKKTVRGRDLLITEGGINHLGRPALVNESFPCEAYNKADRNIRNYHIHGPLCTALDYLGEHELSESIEVCDWLEFKQVGAYGFTESMPYFLCHGMAGEAFIYQGELVVPRTPTMNLEWTV